MTEQQSKEGQAVQQNLEQALDEFDRVQLEEGARAQAERQKFKGVLEFSGGGVGQSDCALVQDLLQKQYEIPAEERKAEVVDATRTVGKQLRSALRAQIAQKRRMDKRARAFGLGDSGQYACDKHVAVNQFSERTQYKPRWAVVGCVWLRAGGLCEVCTEPVDSGAVVRQLQLNKDKGTFCEPNCLLVCKNCDAVWPVKSFFSQGLSDLAVLDLMCALMAKRNRGTKGSKYLNDKSYPHWKELCAKRERMILGLGEALKTVLPDEYEEPISSLVC